MNIIICLQKYKKHLKKLEKKFIFLMFLKVEVSFKYARQSYLLNFYHMSK